MVNSEEDYRKLPEGVNNCGGGRCICKQQMTQGLCLGQGRPGFTTLSSETYHSLQSSTAKPSSTDMPNTSSACIESADIRSLPHSLSFVHVLSTAVYQTCSQCSPAPHGDSSEGLNSGPLQSLSTFLSLSSFVICQDKQPILYLKGLLLR